MPVSRDRGTDFSYARQTHLRGPEREILFWLVEESGIDEETKERLKNKLCGHFVSVETQLASQRMLTKRAAKMSKRFKR